MCAYVVGVCLLCVHAIVCGVLVLEMCCVCCLCHRCMEIGTCASMWPVEGGAEEEAGPGGGEVAGEGITEVGVASSHSRVCASS